MLCYQISHLCLIVKLLISYIYFNTSFAEINSNEVFILNNSVKTITTNAIELGFNDFEQQFAEFKKKYNKKYGTEEEEMKRKFNFLQNILYNRKHNQLADREIASFITGVNQFSDMTEDEYKELFSMTVPSVKKRAKAHKPQKESHSALPHSFDWRTKGMVTPAKRQGVCGSCWAFSVVASIESALRIKRNISLNLSEQQLVDCMETNCKGRTLAAPFNFISRNGGLTTEENYPYIDQAKPCKFKGGEAKVTGYHTLGRPLSGRPAPDQVIKHVLMSEGPLAVIINPKGSDFEFYKGGVLNTGHHNWTLVHAVALIGWGPDYWIIKNSWGTDWGENGFGRIKMGNNCRGINEWIYWPIL